MEKVVSPDYSLVIQYDSKTESVYTYFIKGKQKDINIMDSLTTVLEGLMTGKFNNVFLECISKSISPELFDLLKKDLKLKLEKNKIEEGKITAKMVEALMKEPIKLPSETWREEEMIDEQYSK